jgi:hypothetical protein
MEKGLMSVVVILGFKTEDQVTTAHNPVGDEFDHMAGLARLERPFELIVVDRAWPDRQHRMEEVFGARCRWRYIPPRPSEWVKRGMWSVSCSMNSGAICSVGELLVMSGDFNVFKADQFAFIYDGWFKQRKLYQPVVDFIWGNFQIPEKEEPIVGLNVGPRVLTRAMFWLLNGWDETYDGTKGVEDEDFDVRTDALINHLVETGKLNRSGLRYSGELRLRHPKLVFHKTDHHRASPPHPYDPPWTDPVTPPWYRLRCNLAYMNRVVMPYIRSGQYKANMAVKPVNVEAMRQGCGHEDLIQASRIPAERRHERNRRICTCGREDREQQLESYRAWVPPNVLGFMDRFERMFGNSYGSMNPWDMMTLAAVDEFIRAGAPPPLGLSMEDDDG